MPKWQAQVSENPLDRGGAGHAECRACLRFQTQITVSGVVP